MMRSEEDNMSRILAPSVCGSVQIDQGRGVTKQPWRAALDLAPHLWANQDSPTSASA